MQLVIAHGHVGRTQEIRYVGQNNTPVLNFTFAATDHQADSTTWFKVALWGNHAENIQQYIFKGKELIIQGRLVPDDGGNPQTYEKDDITYATFNLTADRVNFCGSRDDYEAPKTAAQEEDDIPF